MCGNRDRDITVGAVGAQHRSGAGGVVAGSQHFAEGVLWGTHCPARTACRQRSTTAMACVYTFPATSAWLVAFSEQSPGRAGPGWELARHGNLLNQLEVLPAGGRHTTHTCWGSSAAGIPYYSAHTAPAVRLLFPVLPQLCDSLGRAPQSLAACLDSPWQGVSRADARGCSEVGSSQHCHEAPLSDRAVPL